MQDEAVHGLTTSAVHPFHCTPPMLIVSLSLLGRPIGNSFWRTPPCCGLLMFSKTYKVLHKLSRPSKHGGNTRAQTKRTNNAVCTFSSSGVPLSKESRIWALPSTMEKCGAIFPVIFKDRSGIYPVLKFWGQQFSRLTPPPAYAKLAKHSLCSKT